MRRFFPKAQDISFGVITIDGDEFLHMNKVLRIKAGEKIICCLDDARECECKIIESTKFEAKAKIIEIRESDRNPKVSVTLFQGMPKGEKLEFIIQKASELGISEIIPFESQFCVSKWDKSKLERLNRISKEASKQCGRSKSLIVQNGISFENLIKVVEKFDLVIFAYENEKTLSLEKIDFLSAKNVALIIGSEGGFSESEAKLLDGTKAKSVSLGKRILRTETAAVALSSIVMFKLGEMK